MFFQENSNATLQCVVDSAQRGEGGAVDRGRFLTPPEVMGDRIGDRRAAFGMTWMRMVLRGVPGVVCGVLSSGTVVKGYGALSRKASTLATKASGCSRCGVCPAAVIV